MNLASTTLQVLTPMIANRIAAALGLSPGIVTTAIGALIPALLAAFAGKTATPAGAAALTSALGASDPGIAGSLGSLLEGPGKTDLITNGTSALSSLLGGSAPSALADAVSKFAGIDQAGSAGLVGVLAPVVMGHLAQTQKAQGLDAGGLANLLAAQKDNIAAAIPPKFANILGDSGLLDSVADNFDPAALSAADASPGAPPAPLAQTAQPVTRPAAPPMPSAPDAPSFNWMPWAIGLAALFALYWLFGRPAAPPAPAPVEKSAGPSKAVATGLAEALKIGNETIANLTTTLANVKDGATAQAAVPALTSASGSLDSLQRLAAFLPPDARSQVSALAAGALPKLGPLVTNAVAVPGTEGILKPLLDAIVAKLTALSKA